MKVQTISSVPEPIEDQDLIVLDFDGTLFDLYTPWCAAIRREFGLDVWPKDLICWNFPNLPQMYTHRKEILALRTPELYADVVPEPGAQEAVDWMVRRGYRLHCASVDTGPYLVAKQHLLETFFPAIESLDVVGTKEGWRTNFRIDDSPQSLVGARSGALFSQPHNAEQPLGWWIENPQLYRLGNWSELIRFIEYMEPAGYLTPGINK